MLQTTQKKETRRWIWWYPRATFFSPNFSHSLLSFVSNVSAQIDANNFAEFFLFRLLLFRCDTTSSRYGQRRHKKYELLYSFFNSLCVDILLIDESGAAISFTLFQSAIFFHHFPFRWVNFTFFEKFSGNGQMKKFFFSSFAIASRNTIKKSILIGHGTKKFTRKYSTCCQRDEIRNKVWNPALSRLDRINLLSFLCIAVPERVDAVTRWPNSRLGSIVANHSKTVALLSPKFEKTLPSRSLQKKNPVAFISFFISDHCEQQQNYWK